MKKCIVLSAPACCLWLLLLVSPLGLGLVHAQALGLGENDDPDTVIAAAPVEIEDQQIQQRLARIFSHLPELQDVTIEVADGVVILGGSVSREGQAERALDLARRVEGAVTVQDAISRTLDVEGNLAPVVDQLKTAVGRAVRALPLILLALAVMLVIALAGHQVAKWHSLWRRLAPNVFLAELLAQSFRVAAFLAGMMAALSLLGATTLIGTLLGGAGVLGLAIGFAVRDSLENYISSIMLSLRQPFRANDHVLINEHEGKVVRLTSRATVLMTLEGNHLRIPNATVFKGTIVNYTRNPERRFSFDLGVDGADDPIAAINKGLEAISALDPVLKKPEPEALVVSVGDSNIVLRFFGWVDQGVSSFSKVRSLAIRDAKLALEQAGFTLPEPIYRLRFDGGARPPQLADLEVRQTTPDAKVPADQPEQTVDVRPDRHLEQIVNEERARESETDLLDGERPVE